MDITNIGAYTDLLAAQQNSASKISSKIEKSDYSKASDDELLDACKQFESYFLEQMFKEMQKTVDVFKDGNESNYSKGMVDYFKDNAIQALASDSTETQGLGLAQSLYEQMKRNYGLS